jgi:ribonuclease PH
MIGRALRIAVDLQSLAERTVVLDCDVIQADGGTRCCAINGAVLALYKALDRLSAQGGLQGNPMTGLVAAVSVGLVDGSLMLDLDYQADSRAGVDLNVVMTGSGEMVEIQGTAENKPFSEKELNDMLSLARSGIEQMINIQKKVLGIE